MSDVFLKSIGAAALVAIALTLINWYAPEFIKRYLGQALPLFIFFFFYYQLLIVTKKLDEIKKNLEQQK